MCKCTPEIRTPWCGKIGCEVPKQTASFKKEKIDEFNAPRCQEFGKMCEEDLQGNCYFCLRNVLSSPTWEEAFNNFVSVNSLYPKGVDVGKLKAFIETLLHRSPQK